MTYRDDRDADQARIAALETELAVAKQKIAELEGNQARALVRAADGGLALTRRPSGATTWLGAPLEMELVRDFEGTFPADRFEDLVEPCRSITRDAGRTEILKSSMTWSMSSNPKSTGPFITVTLSVRDGSTRLVVQDRLGQIAAAIYGGVGGGVGGGTIILPILAGAALAPVAVPGALLVWLGGTMWGCRALYKRSARKRATKLQRLFDTLAELIGGAIAKPSG